MIQKGYTKVIQTILKVRRRCGYSNGKIEWWWLSVKGN